MPGSLAVLRDSHRAEAERLLARAVEEEVRRSGGRTDGGVLLARGRAALDDDGGERGRGVRARTCARWTRRRPGSSRSRRSGSRAGLSHSGAGRRPLRRPPPSARTSRCGTAAGTALGAGVIAAVAGRRRPSLKVTAAHWPAAHRRAGALRPAGRARAAAAAVADGAGGAGHPAVPGPAADARPRPPAAARPRSPRRRPPQLRGRGPQRGGPPAHRAGAVLRPSAGAGRPVRGPPRGRLAQIAQWVHAARASDRDQADGGGAARRAGLGPHDAGGAGGARAADQFRGACVVDLRGGQRRAARCRPGTRCCIC